MTAAPNPLLQCALLLSVVTGLFAHAQTTVAAGSGHQTSVYTSLDPRMCRTTAIDREAGGSAQICPGIGGFQLRVEDDDARESITLRGPDGRDHPLDLPGVVTPNFSSLGPRAEWRVRSDAGKSVPVALTVRLNVSEDTANPRAITSYVVIARVDSASICVVKVIRSSASALDQARAVADTARAMPCLAKGSGAR